MAVTITISDLAEATGATLAVATRLLPSPPPWSTGTRPTPSPTKPRSDVWDGSSAGTRPVPPPRSPKWATGGRRNVTPQASRAPSDTPVP